MLQAINTKILIAILAALATIGALLVHQNHIHEQEAAAAAKTAALLQKQADDADALKREDEAFRKRVEELKKKSRSFSENGSKTNSYVP